MQFKMQIACLVIVLLISYIYLSVSRKRTNEFHLYRIMLFCTAGNLILDMITVYTVNHLDTVPEWFNRDAHFLFLASISLDAFLVFVYIIRLINWDHSEHPFLRKVIWIPVIASILGNAALPIEYVQTPAGNYSLGPAAIIVYFSMGFYLFLGIIIFLCSFKKIDHRKRTIFGIALLVEFIVTGIQAVFPLTLISGLGLTVLVLAIFLTIENPDRVMMEMYNQERIKAEEATRAKSSFLANMSHEIRTPINAILGMDEMIIREYEDEQLLEYAQNIRSAGNTLLSLINNILDFSKIEAGKIQIITCEYEVKELIHDVYAMLDMKARQKKLSLCVEVAENIPQVLLGDVQHIRQVILNLLSNAIKYTQTGTVTLRVSCKPYEVADEIYLVFEVADTGIGIKKEDMGHLFETFERLDQSKNKSVEGTGLGLSICVQLVELMGGRLRVNSEYGQGSVFSFTIRQKTVVSDPIGTWKISKNKFNEKRVRYEQSFIAPDAKLLIVDDNEMNIKVMVGLLKNSQMNIDTALSGRSCLELLEQNTYHLVFLDHMMPEMDGIEVLRQLQERGNTTPIIMLTANAISGSREQYLDAGFDDYLTKPIDSRKMEQIIIKYLPKELVIQKETFEKKSMSAPAIYGIDWQEAAKYYNSTSDYYCYLADFYALYPEKRESIMKWMSACEGEEECHRYTIEIHAMKSCLAFMGALELSAQAQTLENAGNEKRVEQIQKETPLFLQRIDELLEEIQLLLCDLPIEEEKERIKTDMYSMADMLTQLLEVVLQYDSRKSERWVKEIRRYQVSGKEQGEIDKILGLIADFEYEEAVKEIEDLVKPFLTPQTENTF